MDVVHNTDYASENAYILIGTQFPDGKYSKSQLSLEFADKTGQWRGACSGNACTLHIALQEGAFFNKTGKYVFSVQQFMRADTIKNIESISFKVSEAGKYTPKNKK